MPSTARATPVQPDRFDSGTAQPIQAGGSFESPGLRKVCTHTPGPLAAYLEQTLQQFDRHIEDSCFASAVSRWLSHTHSGRSEGNLPPARAGSVPEPRAQLPRPQQLPNPAVRSPMAAGVPSRRGPCVGGSRAGGASGGGIRWQILVGARGQGCAGKPRRPCPTLDCSKPSLHAASCIVRRSERC